MAEASECFNIGSIVTCKTCFSDEVQGEVVAFDPLINTILLKTSSSSGKQSSCDIFVVNLNFTSQVRVIREAPATPLAPLPSLNLTKLNSRVKRSIEEKSKLLEAMQSGGTVEGQRLFLTIGKTIDEVSWSGSDIIVMNQVIITPPYFLENVIEYKDAKESNAKAVAHVRKIVEKFYKDQQLLKMNNGTATGACFKSASPSNATTANNNNNNSTNSSSGTSARNGSPTNRGTTPTPPHNANSQVKAIPQETGGSLHGRNRLGGEPRQLISQRLGSSGDPWTYFRYIQAQVVL